MKPLQARYNIFTNDGGGAHDDVIFYRLPDRWLLIVNAGNAEKMWALPATRNVGGDVELDRTCTARRALMRDPRAGVVEMLRPHVDVDIAAMKYYTASKRKRRRRRRRSSRAPATPAKTASRSSSAGRRGAASLWDALLAENHGAGLRRAAWARATCCGSKPGCRSTATS